MPRNITPDQLESGWCRHYFKLGNLTWTQAKLLKKGDWLLVKTENGWILGKFHNRTRYNGGDAVYVSTHPEDLPNVTPFYMQSVKLPNEDDMEDAHGWGRPLDENTKHWILKHRELVPDVQTTLF